MTEFLKTIINVVINYQLWLITSSKASAIATVVALDFLLFYIFILPALKKSIEGNRGALVLMGGLTVLVVMGLVGVGV